MHDTRFVRPFAALAAAIFALQLPAGGDGRHTRGGPSDDG